MRAPTSFDAIEASRVRPQDEFIEVDSATAPKRRKSQRRCNSTIKVPTHDGTAYTVYTCQKPVSLHLHNTDVPDHYETGRIRTRDGKVFSYDMRWNLEDAQVWRELK